MTDFQLTRTRIRAGQYEGTLTTTSRRKTTPVIELSLQGAVLSQAVVSEDTSRAKTWKVQAKIPAIAITDGVQTFVLRDKSDAEILDKFAIIAGEALEDDFRAEIAMLRAEVDMLKQAFRRHCKETAG